MADDYEAHPLTASEIDGMYYVDLAALRTGRPPKVAKRRGRTPTMSMRLPVELRTRLNALESAPPGEVIRRAIVEYLERHGDASVTTR